MTNVKFKRILIWIVVLAICYFLFGYLAVQFTWFDKEIYLTLSAIIGGLASVSGLLAFTTNKIEKDDIEKVGIDYFKKVVDSAEELKKKEEELHSKEVALTAKEKEIKELEIKKKEMEYLVKKVSLSLFLKDQLERTDLRIYEISNENNELNRLLTSRKTIINQLVEIDSEIEGNPNAELINEIIEKAQKNKILESLNLDIEGKPTKDKMTSSLKIILDFLESITRLMVGKIN